MTSVTSAEKVVPAEFDATLKGFQYHGGINVMAGYIYGDKKGRFADGTFVFTSTITDQGEDFVQTRNSRYRLEH